MMIIFKLKALMAAKGVSFRQTSKGAKVALSTVQKVANNQTVQTDVLDKLCGFFECSLSDLAEYIPDKEVTN